MLACQPANANRLGAAHDRCGLPFRPCMYVETLRVQSAGKRAGDPSPLHGLWESACQHVGAHAAVLPVWCQLTQS